MMFEQRLDENEGVSHVGVRRREDHPDRAVGAKALGSGAPGNISGVSDLNKRDKCWI